MVTFQLKCTLYVGHQVRGFRHWKKPYGSSISIFLFYKWEIREPDEFRNWPGSQLINDKAMFGRDASHSLVESRCVYQGARVTMLSPLSLPVDVGLEDFCFFHAKPQFPHPYNAGQTVPAMQVAVVTAWVLTPTLKLGYKNSSPSLQILTDLYVHWDSAFSTAFEWHSKDPQTISHYTHF